jgi:hypothetical protein
MRGKNMTLILTWLFPFGICMGADSAISYNSYITEPSGRKRRRILTGGTKTLWIPKIRAGISYWGEGNIDNVTTDVWLSDFIFSHEDQYDNINDFATLLQDELRKLVPEITEPEGSLEYRYGKRGFHLAGFIEHEGKPIPTFYHIHNGQSETTSNINPRITNANYDLPPEKVLKHFPKSEFPCVANGEFYMYKILFDNLQTAFGQFGDLLRKASGSPFIFPDPTKFSDRLEACSEFARFWIRLVRDVYALSNLPEIIGGDISVLSISPSGETKFSRRP